MHDIDCPIWQLDPALPHDLLRTCCICRRRLSLTPSAYGCLAAANYNAPASATMGVLLYLRRFLGCCVLITSVAFLLCVLLPK